MEGKTRNTYKTGSLLFVGSMFIGLGIGMYFDEVATGVLIGMGILQGFHQPTIMVYSSHYSGLMVV